MFRTTLCASLKTIRPTAPAISFSGTPSRLAAYRFLSQDARSQIQSAISSSPVVLFMKGTPQLPECGFSRAVVQVLELQGVPSEKMKTFNVLADPELRSGIKEFSEWPTVPQIYVNGEFVGGCDILLGMHQSGELETLLENNDIIPKIPSDAEPQVTPSS